MCTEVRRMESRLMLRKSAKKLPRNSALECLACKPRG